MKKLFIAILAIILSAGTSFSETRILNVNKPFNKLSTATALKVTYIPSDKKQQITISGPAASIKDVVAVISGKTLEIKVAKKKINGIVAKRPTMKNVSVTVTGPMITAFEASSASSLTCTSTLNSATKAFDIEASSGSSIILSSVSGPKADVEVSSGASVTIKALNAAVADLEASSGAELNVMDLKSKKLTAEASSGAKITLSGKADYGSFEATSGAKINGKSLRLVDSKVDHSSGGSISL